MSDSTHLPDDQTESQLSLENGLAGHVSAHQDAAVSNSLVGVVVAGRDVATSESLCNISVAGRDLHLRQGYGGILVAGNRAMVDGSTIGLLLGKPGSSFTNSPVLMTGRHAIAFGAAMGLAFALSSALLRSRQWHVDLRHFQRRVTQDQPQRHCPRQNKSD